MLKEIRCSQFTDKAVSFHAGLNVTLGDDEAKNSIGKSTFLMVIDFVFGGNSFIKDTSGAIQELGHHHYDFAFHFDKTYFFSRSTHDDKLIYICDEGYARRETITLSEFTEFLKEKYEMSSVRGSFRTNLTPFTRIWKKGNLEPDQPFSASPSESNEEALARLIDLFGRIGEVSAERNILKTLTDRKKVVDKSMDGELIPRITKKQYAENQKRIDEYAAQIEQLKGSVGGAIAAYEELFDEALQRMHVVRDQLAQNRVQLNTTISRLERELSGVPPRITANIALVSDFFPNVDTKRLQQVEAFHDKIGRIVRQELRAELEQVREQEQVALARLAEIDTEINEAISAKGMPSDIFKRLFELKEANDRALNENRSYEIASEIKESINLANERLKIIYEEIFSAIGHEINRLLSAFNRVVYGPQRAPSTLRISAANSYRFASHADTGTGKSYAGLVGFDLAMLSLTPIPTFIHDSIIYKNIEVPATQRILRIFSRVKAKQFFIAFDEAKKYGPATQAILEKSAVLKLHRNKLLYVQDWRSKTPRT